MKIIYRISDNSYKKEKPAYINNETCLSNAVKVFKDADLVIITDHISKETEEMIKKTAPNAEIKGVSIGNGAGTFNIALDIALTYNDDEIVYFLEDDYLHRPGSQKILEEGFELGYPFVTLYDHPNLYKYLDDTKVYLTKSCHWQVARSTTMTFASKVKTLKEVESILRKHTAGTHPYDYKMFRDLGGKVLTSIPGYSTHGLTDWLSPLINWNDNIS